MNFEPYVRSQADDEQDLVDAFVAMGGKPDKSGFINAEILRKVIKEDFGLTVKVLLALL